MKRKGRVGPKAQESTGRLKRKQQKLHCTRLRTNAGSEFQIPKRVPDVEVLYLQIPNSYSLN